MKDPERPGKRKKGVHDRHRERLRQKYMTARDSLADHELLELFLFSLIPRQNTNPTAHALLERFGSLDAVLEADFYALLEVEGVGKKTAFALSQLSYLFRRSEEAKLGRKNAPLDTLDKLGRYFVAKYRGAAEEIVYLLLLDARTCPIDCRKLSEGLADCSEIGCAEIVRFAQTRRATRVVLAHNHPGGSADPSNSDMAATRYIRRVIAPLGITLEEHILVAGESHYPILHEEEKKNLFC